eukprot:TRINITY_DN10980_c0_g2_i10.p2 TRINITY_DN10980_c0_g2~~TRINITY_DN10980_c0_g2_i10.p2  ORF type:complete len:119 (-),score=24.89 TRINITY_DN10980_c0_g2_i10:179-535(-)
MHHRATASFARPVTLLTQVTPGADLVLQVNLQHSENLVASVSLEEFRILLKAPVCPVLKEGMQVEDKRHVRHALQDKLLLKAAGTAATVKLAKYPMHHRATRTSDMSDMPCRASCFCR